MIDRYSRDVMARIFSPERKLVIWLQIELAVAEATAALGQLPADAIERLKQACEEQYDAIIDPIRVAEIEATTRHDVIAFLTHVEELCGDDARFLHLGMTSSDLLDTALAVQLKEAGTLILTDLDELLRVLERRALEHKHSLCIGRSHGIQAEPTTFGLKLATFHAEFARQRRRLQLAIDDVGTCAISGAVGTFANIDPRVEAALAAKLGLAVEPISSQIIPRDRHAAFVCALAQIAGSIERLAVEVRHLQRSEVREVEEFFHEGQKGSSAMPHKRNPILSENLCGLARIVRASVIPALENIALWHERDISHSSVERVMLPDACILTDFSLARLTAMMDRLTVMTERMQANLDATLGLHNSQRVLLALTEAGLPRQRAYEIVQRNAMAAWNDGKSLHDVLATDSEVTHHLTPSELAGHFDDAHHTKHVDLLFERVFGGSAV